MSNPLFTLTDEERAYLREVNLDRERALSEFAARDSEAIFERSDDVSPDEELMRPAFVRDVDRVLNNAFYNRCMDKTQVFPFYRNDDLTRRSYHLQLVSQTARKIGRALRLNEALIEAIALGHDMGHTPFGHGGEYLLSDLYHAHTGRYFNHNVHSVRLLRRVARRNLSLQSLNGMLTHCGEKAFSEYRPTPCESFDELDQIMESCYEDYRVIGSLRPSTLEGCVVRISDILAYLGKDRQDALSVGVLTPETYEIRGNILGERNRDFIRNATVNIIKNSIGKDYLAMDDEVHAAIVDAKAQNWREVYGSEAAHKTLDTYIGPMMEQMYEAMLEAVQAGDESSFIYRHHIRAWMLASDESYVHEPANDIVVDYIASMTDAYFIELYNTLFPEDAVASEKLYVPYFKKK